MSPIDAAYAQFKTIVAQYRIDVDTIVNEADLRFQLLDRIFTEVLGWSRRDIKVEAVSEEGYADYLFRLGDRNAAVIEAKRSSVELVATAKVGKSAYVIHGPVLKFALPGIRQAKSYASDHGCAFAGVTTGLSWVCFQSNRQDGLPFLDGQAIVFPSLESVIDDFSVFYDLYSKEGVAEKRYVIQFSRAEGRLVPQNIEWYMAVDDRRNQLVPRDKLARDLDRVFDRFFKSLVDESDRQMLIDCFVETKESRETDFALQKLAQEVLADISSFSSGAGEELKEEIEEALQTKLGEIVLIIGHKGAGKTTFIDRFFSVVLTRSLRDQCAVLRANLADATQDENSIESWLTETLILQLEERLFSKGVPTYDELQGMYFAEYQRWQSGELHYLYEKDREQFKIQFGEWIRSQVSVDRYGYLLRLMITANRQRMLLPCLVFDNTDQFPQAFQERVFQYAYSIYRATTSFIIVPITDRTIWQLSKAGPLQSYATKSFYLPVPSTKDILEKRIAYIRKRTADTKDAESYFLSKGIKLKLSSITAFATTLEAVFINRDFISRRVSWLANLDLRRSLELTQKIVTSHALRIEQLVTAYVTGDDPRLTDNRITRALIVGNHKFYDSGENGFLQNVFSVPRDRIVSPLLGLSILRLLLDKHGTARDDQAAQYLELSTIASYFEPAGVRIVDVIDTAITMLKARLIEPYDPADDSAEGAQRVRISYAGRMHHEMALTDEQYIDQMALRTAVRTAVVADQIRPISVIFPSDPSPWREAASTFAEYISAEDAALLTIPRDAAYDSQRYLRRDFSKWIRRQVKLPVPEPF